MQILAEPKENVLKRSSYLLAEGLRLSLYSNQEDIPAKRFYESIFVEDLSWRNE